jgi:hypothetical protein
MFFIRSSHFYGFLSAVVQPLSRSNFNHPKTSDVNGLVLIRTCALTCLRVYNSLYIGRGLPHTFNDSIN